MGESSALVLTINKLEPNKEEESELQVLWRNLSIFFIKIISKDDEYNFLFLVSD